MSPHVPLPCTPRVPEACPRAQSPPQTRALGPGRCAHCPGCPWTPAWPSVVRTCCFWNRTTGRCPVRQSLPEVSAPGSTQALPSDTAPSRVSTSSPCAGHAQLRAARDHTHAASKHAALPQTHASACLGTPAFPQLQLHLDRAEKSSPADGRVNGATCLASYVGTVTDPQ